MPDSTAAENLRTPLLDDLEAKVRERTALLEAANQRLQREIGDRLEAETALLASQERYRTLIENMTIGISLIGPDLRIIMANQATGRILGRNPEELVGRKCFEIFSDSREACADCPGSRVLTNGIAQETEKTVSRNGLPPLRLHIRSFPVRDSGGGISGFIKIIEDITEKKRSEEEKEILQAQLHQAQKMKALGTMVAGVAHEINNPTNLLAINTSLLHKVWQDFLPLLEKQEEREPGHKYGGLPVSYLRSHLTTLLADMDMAANRIARIVRDLKQFASRTDLPAHEPMQLNAAVHNGLRLAQTAVRKAGVALDFSPGQEMPEMAGNLAGIEQVVINLVVNALQAIGHDHGRIEISTGFEPGSGRVFLLVADNGPGIAPEIAANLFDPFVTGKHDGDSIGLGLSISYTIVKNHHGEISFRNREEGGALFSVFFPALERRKKAKILVVDDDKMIRDLLRTCLRALPEYEIVEADDGLEGSLLIGTERPELLILDIFMPGMDGLELYQVIRRNPELANMKVLFMTGYSDDRRLEEIARLGGAEILYKPLDIKELRKKVVALLGK